MIVPLKSIRRTPNLLCLIPAYHFKLEAIWQSSDDFLRHRSMSLPAWTPDAQTCVLINPFLPVHKLKHMIR